MGATKQDAAPSQRRQGDEPRRVLAEPAELRAVDVVLPTRKGPEIRARCITQPSEHQRILLHRLALIPRSRQQETDL